MSFGNDHEDLVVQRLSIFGFWSLLSYRMQKNTPRIVQVKLVPCLTLCI